MRKANENLRYRSYVGYTGFGYSEQFHSFQFFAQLQFVAILVVPNTLDCKVLDNKIGLKAIVIFGAAKRRSEKLR